MKPARRSAAAARADPSSAIVPETVAARSAMPGASTAASPVASDWASGTGPSCATPTSSAATRLRPIGLVRHLRHDQLRHARARGGGGCARAAVMHHRRHAWEQRLLVDVPGHETVGIAVDRCQPRPAAGQQHAPPHAARRRDRVACRVGRACIIGALKPTEVYAAGEEGQQCRIERARV